MAAPSGGKEATFGAVVGLVNKLQQICTQLGDTAGNSILVDKLSSIVVVGGQVRAAFLLEEIIKYAFTRAGASRGSPVDGTQGVCLAELCVRVCAAANHSCPEGAARELPLAQAFRRPLIVKEWLVTISKQLSDH